MTSSQRLATRREFLTRGLGLIGVGAALPQFLIDTAMAGTTARGGEPILVVLQLSGGHDGLSAVVPFGNDDYGRNRNATRIAAKDVLKINDEIGLHPNLKGVKELLDSGKFGIVQGVGYPNPNRSHFKSMDIWHLGQTIGRPLSHGWLGRFADAALKGQNDPTLLLSVGGDRTPLAMNSKEHPTLNLRQPDAYRFVADKVLGPSYRKLAELGDDMPAENPNLKFISKTAVSANESSDAILKIARQRGDVGNYPRTPLGTALQTVANLIAGGLKSRIYYVSQGGFDTHAGQKNRHDRLMTEFNDAVVAFQKDLEGQKNAERVLTMSFSEFGRRVRENGSQGTDHGAAAPMFLIGQAVKAGLHGKHPSLKADALDAGDLRFGTDFRGVYATVLEKWLRTPSQPILAGQYPLVDCLT